MPAQNTAILNTIPKSDYLGFFEPKTNTALKVVKFLDLNQNDLASAMGISKNVLKRNTRMSPEIEQRLKEIAIVCEKVAGYFNGNIEKTALWFQTSNPSLGHLSPRDMIRIGQYQRLKRFIENALAGNFP